jgi:hypothetical protein
MNHAQAWPQQAGATMKDAKHLREELNRRADHWTDGWNRTESWINGFLWGIVVVMAYVVFS